MLQIGNYLIFDFFFTNNIQIFYSQRYVVQYDIVNNGCLQSLRERERERVRERER